MKRLIVALLGVMAIAGATAAEPTLRYVDATTLTLIGKAIPTSQPYVRIDTLRYEAPRPTRRMCIMPTGMAVLFRTDSPLIKVRWQTSGKNPGNNWTAIVQKGLDLYIRQGSEWVFAGVARPKIDGRNDRHEDTAVKQMAAGEKECLLYLPLYDRLDQLEIGIAEGATISAAANPFRHKVIIHGSSITHGASASRPGMAYPAILARHTGIEMINLGFSGNCLMQPEFAAYLADVEADAFIFDTFANPSAEIIEERFGAFVDTIRRTHPTTPLIFLQTIVRESNNFDLKGRAFEQHKHAAAEAQVRERMKRDRHIYFVDPGNLLGEDHEATVDGTHPTDLGFNRMVERIEPEISRILARYNIR